MEKLVDVALSRVPTFSMLPTPTERRSRSFGQGVGLAVSQLRLTPIEASEACRAYTDGESRRINHDRGGTVTLRGVKYVGTLPFVWSITKGGVLS